MPGGFDTVLVVDFGAQYAQLIARRVRECNVYSEIVPSTMPAEEMLARRPKAVILSGGPSSVYAEGAPPAPPGLLTAGVPVLGICYGFQLLVSELGGTVERTGTAEYGATALEATGASRLLSGTPKTQQVWMSHGDTCTAAPPGFRVTARTDATPVAAVENPDRRLFGVQFHPEVLHTEHGTRILARFLELAWVIPVALTWRLSPPRVGSEAGAERNWPLPAASTPLIVPATSVPETSPVVRPRVPAPPVEDTPKVAAEPYPSDRSSIWFPFKT